MERPRSAQRAASSAGDQGEATRSGSNTSMPSNPAAAAAAILSSRVPDRQTVAIEWSGHTIAPFSGFVPHQFGEVLPHPAGVGGDSGEQPERLGGLVHGHAAAVERG